MALHQPSFFRNIILAVGIALLLPALTACSALKAPAFVPISNENLHQWEVEGSLILRGSHGKQKTWFRYRELDGRYYLSVLPKSPVSGPKAEWQGSLDVDDAVLDPGSDGKAADIARALAEAVPLHQFGYWLRGLPATGDAMISSASADRVERIDEAGWHIDYHDFMQVQRHLLPQRIRLRQGKKTRVDVSLLRAETGYLLGPCDGVDVDSAAASASSDSGSDPVSRLVPADGSAPLPRWIDRTAFCRQLVKVHGRVPDPRVGLYGPDSMMWKVSAPLAPGGLGAGRALLLQTAHPWITASIDQHSIVRHDPVERARRTFNNVFTMIYGSMPQVLASAHQVHRVHEEIEGRINYQAGAFSKGSEYRANEINAMIWVHATLWETQITMYETLVGALSAEQKEQYYQETKLFAMLFGIPEDALPRSWGEFMAYNSAMWNSPQLTVTDNTLLLRDDLLRARSIWLVFPMWIQKITIASTMPERLASEYQMEPGLWTKMNWFWIRNSAMVATWVLPATLDTNAIHHEAHARLDGERVGPYQRRMIKILLGKERLVN
jgi:uncharacterized protein (DUF2236 family)/outer membrane biogenesis lipoprotein LolB